MITEKDFQEKIENHVDSEEKITGTKEAGSACYELAKQMQPKWISLETDGFPEVGVEVLLAISGESVPIQGWYSAGGWRISTEVISCAHDGYIADNRIAAGAVTHWQPLPEPPSNSL